MTQRATVAVVGAGAGGTLAAIRLLDMAAQSGRSLDIVLVDPQSPGRGIAYSTSDPRHRLNVPAVGMSAYAEDPEHFLRWMRRHVDPDFAPAGFGARLHYAEYLKATLEDASRAASATVRIEVVRAKATDLSRHGRRWRLLTADGVSRQCDAVILASGAGRPSTAWAPQSLVRSPRFVADPWARPADPATPGAQVVLVGASLTMADMAMSWGRAGTSLHAVSRRGLMPLGHHREPRPRPAPPDLTDDGELTWPELRHTVFEHIKALRAEGVDWRSAVDSLRPVTSELWQRLSEAGRTEFLRSGVRRWNRVRHRVEPSVAAWLDARIEEGSLQSHAAEIIDAQDTDDAVRLVLSDGRTLAATTVINCTGPCNDVSRSDDPLMMNLLSSGLAQPDSLRIGLRCDSTGRLVSADGGSAAVWTVGPLRQGRLWESTAIPEIRVQAAEVAAAVLQSLPGSEVRRRPRDPYGLPLTAHADAAHLYVEGLGRILRVQSGAVELLQSAVEADPAFALGHAALALLGAEWDVDVDVEASLRRAHRAVDRADERESRFVHAVTRRVVDPGSDSAATLISYVRDYPEDALAVSVTVPTIAFGGATELPTETYALVDGLAPAYGDDWWFRGLRAFFLQEREQYDEAAVLADLALAAEPGAGHAVHARTHVYYETGQHAAGLGWLDGWIRTCGRDASHRAHFAWHAALHELALGRDCDAIRRYRDQLAPPTVSGVRALVDSASLLWRGRMVSGEQAWAAEDVRAVLDTVPAELLREPGTPFVAMHAAVALAAAGDCRGLAGLRRHAFAQGPGAFTDIVAPLADALVDLLHGDAGPAAQALSRLGRLDRLGGSAAQREVIEETVLFSATQAGDHELARVVLEERLGRRPSARDASLLRGVPASPTSAERR